MNKYKKGFTLIELLVVIAVVGILVLLATPRFLGHTQNAELTKGFANARTIEKASEVYYMHHDDWPRLTDDPYTSEEIESYSERIFNHTGQEVNLDPDGNYYDIDYDKLSDYVQVPDDKENYILQNPVGKVYYMENLTEVGIARVNYSSAKEDNSPTGPRKPVEGEIPIDSAEGLAKIGTEYPLDGEYILTANINLSGYSEGEGWTPIGTDSSRFTGSFDGNGYSITGLTIDRPGISNVGLFGYTEGATVSNVGLENVNITGRSQVGGLVGFAYGSTMISNSYSTGKVTGSLDYVGGLVGTARESTNISNSYATVSVTGRTYVGGLVGLNRENTEISNSYSTGSVSGSGTYVGGLVGAAVESTISNSYATGSVKGTGSSIGGYAGGLVGIASSGIIENSYSTGSVTSTSRVGGLMGYAGGSINISNSYATGSVEGVGTQVGGLAGYAESGTKISSSYWDRQTTGRTGSAGGGVGKLTYEMKKQTTYEGWDFDEVWSIKEGESYPKLR